MLSTFNLPLLTFDSYLADALALVADCKPPAALGATGVDDAAPALGTHAGQEAVLAFARYTLRLVSALDHPLVSSPISQLPLKRRN